MNSVRDMNSDDWWETGRGTQASLERRVEPHATIKTTVSADAMHSNALKRRHT